MHHNEPYVILGAAFPTLCEKCTGSLTSPGNEYREDAGTGPAVIRPHPRGLECLTI